MTQHDMRNSFCRIFWTLKNEPVVVAEAQAVDRRVVAEVGVVVALAARAGPLPNPTRAGAKVGGGERKGRGGVGENEVKAERKGEVEVADDAGRRCVGRERSAPRVRKALESLARVPVAVERVPKTPRRPRHQKLRKVRRLPRPPRLPRLRVMRNHLSLQKRRSRRKRLRLAKRQSLRRRIKRKQQRQLSLRPAKTSKKLERLRSKKETFRRLLRSVRQRCREESTRPRRRLRRK